MFTAFITTLVTLTLGPVGDADKGPSASTGTGKTFIENGTGLNQGNAGTKDIRAVAASSNEDIDLQTFLDLNQVALALNEVVLLRLEAATANLGNLEVKPSAANGWFGAAQPFELVTTKMTLIPGGVIHLECRNATAYAVTGAIKSINIANIDGVNTNSYTITIIGRK